MVMESQSVGAALVVAQHDMPKQYAKTICQNNMIDATEKGQAQGIAPTAAKPSSFPRSAWECISV